ncbi:MAG TPA: MFS transporter [Streptosporangiaceae bacterium]|nr:MFS transporter [Streptosporangiaceae bacterium]
MPLYPVYAVLFIETGLSAAEISSLFAIWSVTGFVLEVPSGVWADVFSRRWLLTIAPALGGVGFALWTFVPSYLAFAVGFVLWGAGSAMQSGTQQALVYEELKRVGAAGAYARLTGRAEAASTAGQLIATALTGPVLAAGGYEAVGVASVATTLLAAAVGRTLPEARATRRPRAGRGTRRARRSRGTHGRVLRRGLAEVRRSRSVLRVLVLAAVLMGVSAIDEYVPLLVRSTGVGPTALTLLVGLMTVGFAVGGLFAGRGTRLLAPALAAAAGCLAAGALSGSPIGIPLVAVAFGVFQWAHAAAEARLQDQISDDARATVTSLAGLGTELVGIAVFAGYAAGSLWLGPGPLFALVAVPYVIVALVLARGSRRDPRGDPRGDPRRD